MDDLVQCPVCTLFLHNGITLESHLDTHPKDQVIKALCNITTKGSGSCASSRTSTPANSERSYRSRSRTPAPEDGRWNSSNRNNEKDKYWGRSSSGTSTRPTSRTFSRTPSRTTSRTTMSMSSNKDFSRNATPDTRMIDNLAFETTTVCSSSPRSQANSMRSYHTSILKADKTQQTYPAPPTGDFEQQCMFYPEQQEDREIKYSRTPEYNANDMNNGFAYNVPTIGASVKLQSNILPNNVLPKKRISDTVRIMPKFNNTVNLVKNNVSGMAYLAPGGKPLHVMVPSSPTFVQKNVQNSLIMTGALPNNPLQIDSKTVTPMVQNRFNHITSGAFTPGTTVVTQNSQYFYQEMVQNIDPKSFISSIPSGYTGHENVTNVAHSSSLYQNVMLVDPFGNPSCMYATPQQIVTTKPCTTQAFQDSSMNIQQTVPSFKDSIKTLIIEVGPLVPPAPVANTATSSVNDNIPNFSAVVPQYVPTKEETPSLSSAEISESSNETPVITKGLKILSNIKVEVPVQHSKNMINTVMDLTGCADSEYPVRPSSPAKKLPLVETIKKVPHDFTQPSTSKSDNIHTLADLKKISNTSPTSIKDSTSKISNVDNKLDAEYSDSCSVPDLICNEKPSISPISELSENGDNSRDRTSISPKPLIKNVSVKVDRDENKIQMAVKPFRGTALRLNNIYVKKNKKVLKIKNLKGNTSKANKRVEPIAGSSSSTVHSFSRSDPIQKTEATQASKLKTISIEEIKDKEELSGFGADVAMQSAIIESIRSVVKKHKTEDNIQIKEEISTSNEFSHDSERHDGVSPLDPLRPINVVNYGHMSPSQFDEESSHRELLDLEGASKSKQFVSMMNDNYFGDNIYADYFTPDKVEAFDDKGPTVFKESGKEAFSCNIWGEPSAKDSEFVLPHFIHESCKIVDSGMDYMDGDRGEMQGSEMGEKDCKADLLSESRSDGEPSLNICADERMPPRGELSGQESNGDMESAWNGMYSDLTPAEPYDLIARESWVSDGSELDATERRDNLEDELHFPKVRLFTCSACGGKFPSLKELRLHKSAAHSLPSSSGNKTSYSRMVTARIKKEEKIEHAAMDCTANILAMDTKETITSTILQVYDTIEETKPKLENLQRIIKRETKRRKRDYVCPTCKVDQLTDAAFNAHLKIHPLECLTCGKCFYKRANLQLHIKTHLGIKNYKCDICEKRFLTRQKLSEHHNIHTGRTPVKCTHCDDTFRRYSNMLQHRDRHHFKKRTKVRDFVCQCGAVFHSRAKYLWHKEIHDDKPKACLYCSDKFVHAASLTRHVRRSHNQYYLAAPAGDNVPCPVCKKIYLRSNLRMHMATHSGKREFPCVVCNKAFTTKWNLKLHRWTHAARSAKPHKCVLCPAAFVRPADLAAHVAAHKQAKHYTCNTCGCRFLRKYNCQRHVREHDAPKRHACTVPGCGKAFHRSYYLAEHMKVHSGARPFACNVCGKTSSNKSNHNKHVKIHHAREPVAFEA